MRDLTRRDVAKVGITGALAACATRAFGLSRDSLWFVDPELRPAARRMQALEKSFPPFSDATLPMARKGMSAFASAPRTDIPHVARRIEGVRGAPDVAVLVVNAKPGARRAGLLHTHGGGFIVGRSETNLSDLQDLAAALDCTIVSVDYRLAPETRYAGSIEDNYAGLRWLHANADQLGVDVTRIGVTGESAGGGHAALLAIVARDRGEVPVRFQSLVYPMLDDRTGSTRPMPAPIGTLVWNAEANRYGWASFLGRTPGSSAVPAAAVPGRVADLRGLPPAWIGVGSIDLFVSEDVSYARRLIEAGVPTDLMVVAGAFHGFDGIARDTAPARGFRAARIDALRRGLASQA